VRGCNDPLGSPLPPGYFEVMVMEGIYIHNNENNG
jgi:hypothetical protein